MYRRCYQKLLPVVLSVAVMLGIGAAEAHGQSGSQGSVVLTVTDPSGAVIEGANLELVQIDTNDARTAQTVSKGTYTFVNLTIGTYRLTVSKPGYSTKIYDALVVQAAQVKSITAILPLGAVTQTVDVAASSVPVLETSSNAIGVVIDMKQIEDLPLGGRDLTQLTSLVAGYNGTFNGLPSNDQGSNIDGVMGSPSRAKYVGNVQPAVSPRIENIAEMTVQTDQLDLNSGFGQSSMQANFVSRRGSNKFHGRVYEDFQNSGLNANSWYNNAVDLRKNKLILNDFGGSIGGPILHDKLFFFGSFAMSKQPGSATATNNIFTTAAQAGTFTYSGGTVNVFSLAQQANAGLPTTTNAAVAAQLALINTAAGSGAQASTSDPNYNSLAWINDAPSTTYFPSARVDYNMSGKVRMYLSWMMTKQGIPASYAATFPGASFTNQVSGYATKNYTTSYGVDWIISPVLINQFKVGFLYNNNQYSGNAKPLYATEPTVFWGMNSFGASSNNNMSGQVYPSPVSNYYPVFNVSDSVTWQHAGHTVQFGGSWYREQDHYWNPPVGFPNYNLGLANGDPALNAFSTSTMPGASSYDIQEAGQLYAILTGRISGVNGTYPYSQNTQSYEHSIGAYNLDELSTAFGLFLEDSWKITPRLTLNYGLRWDFTGDNHDLTGAYHSASPGDIYGPSGLNNLFNPGSLLGNQNPLLTAKSHVYDPWKLTPQPAFGFSYNPKVTDGPFKALLGGEGTVIRGGFALRRFTEPYQYYWNNASDYGAFFFQGFSLTPNTTGQTGTFSPGSLSLGGTMPAYAYSPTTYVASAPQSDYTFIGNAPGVNGINPNIQQPYSESWNFGIQREIGKSRVLEVRYNGNRTIHQWISVDPNEVNVFENGFLAEFKKAQANLTANGGTSFAGANALPIFTAAFGGAGASDFSNAQYIRYLQTGQVGAMASVLSGINGTVPYFCNLVGSGFSPCANNAGYSGSGAGYPINFFQANPYAAGSSTGYMVAAGYSNYHALQVDLRQGTWKGLQFDANYTLSHSLGVSSPQSWTASFNAFTLRDLAKSYGPSQFDLRNVLHMNGTYDLPFGHGKTFLGASRLADEVLGHWTVGSIVTFQSGLPKQITGGYYTYNDYGDGGVSLSGVTSSQIQKSIGVHRVVGQPFADLIDPKYLASPSGGANSAYISPNTTPGTIGNVIYVHGPHAFYQDVSISKAVPIREGLNFRIQGEFLNAWNHPVFGASSSSLIDAGVQDNAFGTGYVSNSPRAIELRANFEF